MKFPDPNIGYVFDYKSEIIAEGILITFLRGRVRILFRFADIDSISRETYQGGKISWDVIRWGKCPTGREALKVRLRRGAFRDHLVVFEDLAGALHELKIKGCI